MTKQWIDRWTCDRCGKVVETDHSDGTWPKGWRSLRWASFVRDGYYCPECGEIIEAALKMPDGAK